MITNLIASLLVYTAPIKVAVIDTGYNSSNMFNASLCESGHKDFTEDQIYNNGIPADLHGHGTNVAGLIHQHASGVVLNKEIIKNFPYDKMSALKKKNTGYCLVIIKAFSLKSNLKWYIDALKYAETLKVQIVNISAGGYSKEKEELALIKKMLDNKKIIVAAAGNDGKDIDLEPYYPASADDRVVVVGNSNKDIKKETNNKIFIKKDLEVDFSANPTSNYGSVVDIYVQGYEMVSLSNKPDNLSVMSGTSQATAAFTGDIINLVFKLKNKGEIK